MCSSGGQQTPSGDDIAEQVRGIVLSVRCGVEVYAMVIQISSCQLQNQYSGRQPSQTGDTLLETGSEGVTVSPDIRGGSVDSGSSC